MTALAAATVAPSAARALPFLAPCSLAQRNLARHSAALWLGGPLARRPSGSAALGLGCHLAQWCAALCAGCALARRPVVEVVVAVAVVVAWRWRAAAAAAAALVLALVIVCAWACGPRGTPHAGDAGWMG